MRLFSHPVRTVAVFVLIILVIVGAWLGPRAYAVYSGIGKITHVVVPTVSGEPTVNIPPVDPNHRINILLLGSDNDQKKEEAAPLTQSMIVVTIDPRNHSVGMLSIPRDFWVPIAGHGTAKIDLAFKYGYQSGFRGVPKGFKGGVALARYTVEHLFHVTIDYYAWVGLQGFANVIDTFNGISLDVQHPVLDDTYPNDINSPDPYGERRLFIPAGWQHLDGPSALEYVRSRHGDRIGDFGRSARQQQVLELLRQKITAMNVLPRLPTLVSDLQDSIRTDLSLQQLYQLEQLSHAIHHQDIHRLVLAYPFFCNYGYVDYQSVLLPYWNKILPVVQAMFSPLSRPTATPRPTATVATASPTTTATAGASPTPAPTVTPTPAPPSMSHVPNSLLFIREGNLYRLTPSGKIVQLTWSGDAAMPAVAPDRHTIAFVRFTTGLHKYDKYASDIWIMNLNNQKQHIITNDENKVPANNLWAAWPSWSSNGREILFSYDRQKLSTAPSDARPTDLAVWEMNARGGGLVQLTQPAVGAGGDTEPAWRPHSTQFLYVAWNYDSNNRPYSQLVLRVPGGSPRYLTRTGARVVDPIWSPNGRDVAFIYDAVTGATDQLVVARLSRGKLVHWRTLATGDLAQPDFTPNGGSISYLRLNGDGFTMELRNVSNETVRRVTALPSDVDARWRPVWIQ